MNIFYHFARDIFHINISIPSQNFRLFLALCFLRKDVYSYLFMF